jgi:hypothetical protein
VSRRKRQAIGVAVVFFCAAVPLFLVLRKRGRDEELERWLDRSGYVKAECPEDPFGRRDAAARCWAGERDGVGRVTLMLGERWQAETANVPKGSGIAQERYIGLAVPKAEDAWLAAWQKVVGRGGDRPIRAARSGEGAILVWRGLHTHEEVEKHLAELDLSLR